MPQAFNLEILPFRERIANLGPPLRKSTLGVLQVNVGKLCNLTCVHCHVDAGPSRQEIMTRETADACLRFLADSDIPLLDITGGAPELCPEFDHLVRGAHALGRRVMVRCNLTVIFEPGKSYLPEFYRSHAVELVCSLPCYSRENVEMQRGKGVFDESIRALQKLNDIGYGRDGRGLILDLVYNPVRPSLPPAQDVLEADFKKALGEDFGIVFNNLITITNMPIARYATLLKRTAKYDEYMHLLADHFNPETRSGLMCRTFLSVSWDGQLYDCDFNQMLNMKMLNTANRDSDGRPATIDSAKPADFEGRPVLVDDHCYGCTAGAGSSCGGAIAS
jgi:radical SAM/Cys-rich protein